MWLHCANRNANITAAKADADAVCIVGCACRRRWNLAATALTRNQVELMQIDSTASDNLPGFRVLGISPRTLEAELDAMLKQGKWGNSKPDSEEEAVQTHIRYEGPWSR
jgi:hypothetical protein